MSRKRDKTPTNCLESFIWRLQDIQSALPTAWKSDKLLHNKLPNAVKTFEACKLAYFKLEDTLFGLISVYHASIASTPIATPRKNASDAMFVDRKFNHNRDGQKKRYIVCHKEGCWSTNRPPTERLKALQRKRPSVDSSPIS